MADSQVLIEIKTTSKGLVVATKDTEKLVKTTKQLNDEQKKQAKTTDTLNKKKDATNKKDKSLYQSNLSASKGFSKMKETLGSQSSGLVQAYATLAANVFAATAAFTALRQASQVDTMIKALDALGTASGNNLTAMARSIQATTGHAIALDQALRTVSVGASAGFDTSQLQGLAEVGRLAAISLGRDVGDAVDRLTRGAAKLEPEILDELGIFVRIDDAAAKYAASIGVAASSLSRFEKRQAFANEILEQGRQKFSAVADVEPSNFDKLAATMADLSRNLMNFFNAVLSPIAGFFADNTLALAGFFAMITKGVIQQALPALSKFGDVAKRVALDAVGAAGAELDRVEKTRKAQISQVKGVKIVSGEYQKYFQKIKSGKFTLEDLNQANKKLSDSIRRRQDAINRGTTKNIKLAEANIAKIKQEQIAIQNLIQTEQRRENLKKRGGQGSADALFSGRESRIFGQLDKQFDQGNYIKGFQNALKKTIVTNKRYDRDIRKSTKGTKMFGLTLGKGVLGKALLSAKIGMKQFGLVARLSIKGIFTAIPVIGQLLLVIDLLIAGLKKAITFFGNFKGEASNLTKAQDAFNGSVSTFNKLQKSSVLLIEDEKERRKANLQETIAQGQATINLIDNAKEVEKAQRAANKEASLYGKLLKGSLEIGRIILSDMANTLGGFGAKSKRALLNTRINFLEFTKNVKQQIQDIVMGDSAVAKAARFLFGIEKTDQLFDFDKMDREIDQLRQSVKDVNLESAFRFSGQDRNTLGTQVVLSAPFEAMQEVMMAATDAGDEFRAKLGDTTPAMLAVALATGDISKASENLDKNLQDIIKTVDANTDGYISQEEIIDAIIKITDSATQETNQFTRALQVQAEMFKESEQKAAEYVNSLKATNKELALAGELGVLLGSMMETDGEGNSFFTITPKDKENQEDFVENLKKMGTGMRRLITGGGSADELNKKIEDIGNAGEDVVEEFYNQVKAAQQLVRQIGILQIIEKERLATMQRQAAVFKTMEKKSATAALESIRTQNAQRDIVKERLDLQIQQQEKILGQTALQEYRQNGLVNLEGEELEFATKLFNLEGQRAANESKRLNHKHEAAMLEEVSLGNARLAFQLAQAQVATAAKEVAFLNKKANISKGIGGGQTPQQLLEAQKVAAKAAVEAAKTELALLDSKLKIETLLLEAKFIANDISMEENKRAQQILEELNAQHGVQKLISAEKIKQASIDANSVGQGDFKGLLSGGVGQTLVAGAALFNEQTKSKANFDAEGNELETRTQSTPQERLEAMNTALAPMRETLMGLGPEGELVATAQQGILTLASAFDVVSASGLGSAEGMAAVGSAIASVSSIMAANSKAQIAEIDKQIEAEKKRDGKSADSLNKIKGMEKKKEAMERKAFERNKKMQMAQTVANTAASIMGVMSGVKDPFVSAPLAIAQAAMFAVMGAAQLAVISKQKYDGGSTSVEKPQTNLSIGKRSNAVDVSRGATAGELNYLRGGRTTGQNLGGAGGSLPGAAMGRKGYADGGVVVGERGPEVISPTTQVDVTPNYALGGGETNVNFTINAVDAAGVEDVLMNQRGNIIRMIREAANDHGEMFLEDIDTQTYGSNT